MLESIWIVTESSACTFIKERTIIMRFLITLTLLLCIFLANAGDLLLKDGLVLRDAQVRGVSGKTVVIVKHADGLGMYGYNLFSPDSAAVISNLFPAVAVPSPKVKPVTPTQENKQSNDDSAAKRAEAASNIRSSALTFNNRYYQTAKSRVGAAIRGERAKLERSLSQADDIADVKREISRLESRSDYKKEYYELRKRHPDYERTIHTPRGRIYVRDSLNSDQKQTLRYKEIKKISEQLDESKARLKKIERAQQKKRHSFEYAAAKRLKSIEAIYKDHMRRLQAGEAIDPPLMEARFLGVK